MPTLAKRRFLRKYPKPKAPEDGIFIVDPWSGKEVFVRFDELKEMCGDSVAHNDVPHYKRDPSYNWRQKREPPHRK